MARDRGSGRRMRSSKKIVQLRRLGFRFIALADDNFYPVTLTDLELARLPEEQAQLESAELENCARSDLN